MWAENTQMSQLIFQFVIIMLIVTQVKYVKLS